MLWHRIETLVYVLPAFELWTITPNVQFDNMIITDNEAEAEALVGWKGFDDSKHAWLNYNCRGQATELWAPKRKREDDATPAAGVLGQVLVRGRILLF